MDHDPADEMSALYRSFCQAVSDGNGLDDFSKDDLIDIYDFTRSIPDDYIANEAIAVGLRRYPGSKDILKRKGLFFHDLGQDNVCEIILLGLPERAFTRSMAAMKNEIVVMGNDPMFKEALEIYTPGSVEDGDLLYMVDIFDAIDRLDIISENADALSRISQYPSTIFQELYVLLYEKGEFEKARYFGHRLTEVDPFNLSAWIELAYLYLTQFSDPESAIECSEYALAIDPADIGAKMIRALSVYEKNPDETKRIVREVLQQNPDEPRALYVEACVSFHEGRQSQGVELSMRACRGFGVGQRREALDLLLRSLRFPLSPDQRALLEEFVKEDSDLNISRWVRELVGHRSYHGAYELAMLSIKLRRFTPTSLEEVSALVESMYRLKLYDEIVNFISNEVAALMDLHPFYALIFAVAHYRLHNIDYICRWLDDYLSLSNLARAPRGETLDGRLLRSVSLEKIRALRRSAEGDTSISDSMFDPFAVGE